MKKNFLKNKEFIFIDFDGTIKQSDDVKAKAFIKIFGNNNVCINFINISKL